MAPKKWGVQQYTINVVNTTCINPIVAVLFVMILKVISCFLRNDYFMKSIL